MKKENINISEINELAFTKIEKVIDTSLQHLEQVKKIVEFNKQNNFEYIIKTDTMAFNEVINYLLTNGYEIVASYDNKKELKFRHK